VKLVPKWLEDGFLAGTMPLVRLLIRGGVSPNLLTTVGALVVVASAVAFGAGWIRWGGALLLLSGGVDTLDGQVARITGRTTKFGAFYDSTLDRVGDGATFFGIAIWMLTAPGVNRPVLWAVVCLVAALSALVVSYQRARAEGLGLDCKVGIAQRAERLIGIGLPALVFGAGPGGMVLQVVVSVMAVLSLITVVQRFKYVYEVTAGS
jgi:CDP-diacylglycerol---glycerol-3-phosphate 3-phosphatidyltransferase